MNLKVGTGIYTGSNKLINRNCDARGDWSRWKGRRKVRSRQRRSLLVVLAAVLAILTGAWFALARSGAVRENGTDGIEVLADLTADQIAGIYYQAAGSGPVAFTRINGQWHLAGGADQTAALKDDAIDQAAVSALASSLTGVRLYQTITDVTDLKQYDLDRPQYQVEITDTSGNVTRITVGAYNETAGKLYCLLGDDRETVYAVSPALAGSLTKTADGYSKNESES